MFEKIAILGGGAFGIALAKIAARHTSNLILWARDAQVCAHINKFHRHPTTLNNIILPEYVQATTDLAYALDKAPVVILTLPMQALRSVLVKARPFIDSKALVLNTAKGIEPCLLELPCDIIKQTLAAETAQRACYLSGPSFAAELAAGLPTALTLASYDRSSAQKFQKCFSQKNLRLYYSDDVVSALVGGALKNVIAIAAGACTGLGLGRNALASLITRGLAEIGRLAKSMGGRTQTLSGLSGVGDLVLSCTDNMSRNHRLGALLAENYSLQDALDYIGSVVEGAKTAQAIPGLIQKYRVDMPISEAVYRVLYENMALEEAMSRLLDRVPRDEHA
jgi:glycerol-3-phosphate dehydrogenase (NAD(P)+)